MFENIINFFKKLIKNDKGNSKDTAKERLHLVLAQDRANISVDFLEMMKQEIIEVIKKYIEVDEKAIDVRLTNKVVDDGTNSAPSLYANIPIITIKNEARKLQVDKKEEEKENKAEVEKKEEDKIEETEKNEEQQKAVQNEDNNNVIEEVKKEDNKETTEELKEEVNIEEKTEEENEGEEKKIEQAENSEEDKTDKKEEVEEKEDLPETNNSDEGNNE